MKTWYKILVLLFIASIFIYAVYNIYFFKEQLYWINRIEIELWKRYVIGYNWTEKKICDKYIKYWCLEGNIIAYKVSWNDIYVYYKPHNWFQITSKFLGWDQTYKVFGPYDAFITNAKTPIPPLFKINSIFYWREFYQKEDISKLSKDDKEIFDNLLKYN